MTDTEMAPQDLVIIGGGTAGLVTAVGAAGVGARVTLVEADRTGGDCLWTGCVPSKALISAASAVHSARTADRFGLGTAELDVDLGAVMEHVAAAQAAIEPHDSPERLRREGVTVIEGRARLSGRGTVDVQLATGGSTQLRTRTALLATGSRPVLPPVDGLTDVDPLTSDTVWGLRQLPARLLVLGGGAVGCELAQAFSRLGSSVTLVEMAPRLLPTEEPEASAQLLQVLLREGIDVRVGVRGVEVTPGDAPDGHTMTLETTDSRAQRSRVSFDRVLVAAGRAPNTEDLGLEANRIATRRSGHVIVDETMRTTADWVFAAGDVNGVMPFTHAAGAQAGLVVTNALFGLKRAFDTSLVPYAIFTDPELGRVGMTEAQAVEEFGAQQVTTASFAMSGLDRAIAAAHTDGFAKVITGPRDRIVGGTVLGARGGDVIAPLTAWIRNGATLRSIGETTLPYPTWSEGLTKAAGEVLRERFLSPRTRRLARPVLGTARMARKPWKQ